VCSERILPPPVAGANLNSFPVQLGTNWIFDADFPGGMLNADKIVDLVNLKEVFPNLLKRIKAPCMPRRAIILKRNYYSGKNRSKRRKAEEENHVAIILQD
jgi:hypothetical protein